ncbi:uncharacterized protein Fot_22860 [Forsythia ovata]|uniref:Ubiquitin-like protease family profile domain-containing protein n=1 Tax=Forsythia ovata TaxID=205694 RepID=A0ABD1UYX0_9LAMI
MACNTLWWDVDHVLLPVMMQNRVHWILLHFDIVHRCLNVFNSYRKVIRDNHIRKTVKPYVEIISYLLHHSGFYKAGSSSVVDWSAYDGKDPFDELDFQILGKIPQQYQMLV